MRCINIDWLFQFHKGTIKPFVRKKVAATNPEFQFHKGTIKPVPLGVTVVVIG